MADTPPHTVKETGAVRGDVLVGIRTPGRGLLLKIEEPQQKGRGARICGSFSILDPGYGELSGCLELAMPRPWTADELIAFVEGHGQTSTQFLNANSLARLRELLDVVFPSAGD